MTIQKIILVSTILFLCNAIQAQEEIGAPYNPDVNADSLINLPDMLGVLPLFGQPFLPSEDDLDSTNEIQSLYLSGDTLYLIPDGGYIPLNQLFSGANDQYVFSCVDMGVGEECWLVEGVNWILNEGYYKTLRRTCDVPVESLEGENEKPTWRRFRVSHPDITDSTQIALMYVNHSYPLQDNRYQPVFQKLSSPFHISQGIEFYIVARARYFNPGNVDDLGPADAVNNVNSLLWGTAENSSSTGKGAFEIYINNGAGWLDTNIRFDIQ
jgi:hypothetical protein